MVTLLIVPPPYITWVILHDKVYWKRQGCGPQQFLQVTTTTPEGGARCIDLIFNMVANTVAEERPSEYELRNALSLYIITLQNFRGLVYTYLTMMNDILLAKLGHNVSVSTPLTRIAIFQVLGSKLFYNHHL